MEFKRYIFLDVDGVLNHPNWYENRRKKPILGNNYASILNHLDPQKVALLNQLEGCEVVISSSWGFEECSEGLPQTGLKLPVISGINARELEKRWLVRGNSIAEWFVERFGSMPRDTFGDSFEADRWWHPGTKYDFINGEWKMSSQSDIAVTYVIFDDNADMLLDQVKHFIHVNPNTGLTQEDINKAKKMLNL